MLRWGTVDPAKEERQEIRRGANFVGILLLAIIAAETLITTVLPLPLRSVLDFSSDTYGLGNTGYLLFNMILYLLHLVVPTVIVALVCRRDTNPFPTRRVGGRVWLVIIFGGLAMMIFANYITSLVLSWLQGMGVPMPEFPDTVEPTWISLVLNLIGVALLPGLVEEMIFRGYVLEALRPCGDGTAILISAALFGLLHGNVEQVPFAFVVGVVLAFVVVKTGSIWPAVVLHMANNAMSAGLEFLEARFPEYGDLFTPMLFAVLAVLGTAVVGIAKTVPGEIGALFSPLPVRNTALPLPQKRKAGLTAPVLLVATAVLILEVLLSTVR